MGDIRPGDLIEFEEGIFLWRDAEFNPNKSAKIVGSIRSGVLCFVIAIVDNEAFVLHPPTMAMGWTPLRPSIIKRRNVLSLFSSDDVRTFAP